jgi:hypothetical protein
MQIVFICPAVQKITGGIKCIFRMAATLRRLGYDAVVFEPTGSRPTWFATDVPVFDRRIFKPTSEQIVVLPEDQPIVLERFARRPQRKVVYCQNHFYAAMSMVDSRTYGDFGVSHILCSGRTIYDYCRHRHPDVPAHVIPIGVNPQQFYPRPKTERIAYIPRKRPVEALYIRDLFRFEYPRFRDIEWLELKEKTEQEIAEAVGGSTVFLVLHKLDSLPLTGLEAMVSGCVVAGFTGIGGREYARPENGFWVDEDDYPGCVRGLAEAVWLSRETGPRREAYAEACSSIASRYTPAVAEEAIRNAWADIVKN